MYQNSLFEHALIVPGPGLSAASVTAWQVAKALSTAMQTPKSSIINFELTVADSEGRSRWRMQVKQAIDGWPQLMSIPGVRLGSPATAGDATTGWFADFWQQAMAKSYRIDFICVHW